MMNPGDSATFDLQIIETHRKFKNEGKTKEQCWKFIEENYNIMNVGLPVYMIVNSLWKDEIK